MTRIQFPNSSYRLQLSRHLTFEQVRGLVGYLSDLGMGAAYLSPFFRAATGSTHGYDVVDPRQLDPSLGTEEDFGQLAETLRVQGMGMIVDIVPNHMGIADPHNVWWQDVLENGPASTFAKFFDIDWNPPKEALRGKVLLPVLGDQFGRIVEEGQLQLAYEDQRFAVRYFEHAFPTDPRSWVGVLRTAVDELAPAMDADVPERMELESIMTSLEHLPPRTELASEAISQRYREKEVARRRLAALIDSSREVAGAMAAAVTRFNGRRGEPASFDKLEGLLADQPYRLCYWRVATDEINYRRFFDVDSLAAIRVEDPQVFEAVHEAILQFIARGWVTALRIDHADGLREPQRYLADLAAAVRQVLRADSPGEHGASPPLYTVVEKILAFDEGLPADWQAHGTTGYDFLNLLNGVFVDRLGAYSLRDVYARFLGAWEPFSQVLYESERTILATSLSAEMYVLSYLLDRISEQHRWSRDFTRFSLFRALREVVACFPVYRTYIRPEAGEVHVDDRRRIQDAVRLAKRRNPAMSPTFFDFIASVLLLEIPEGLSEEDRQERMQFVLRFQQFTGPVKAKGLEDTAFYRYCPLVSLNEVGGDPAVAGVSIEQFHRRVVEQSSSWPHTMLSSGTHDTKRGEDLRARLNVLSEAPGAWEEAVRRWRDFNAGARVELDGAAVPDANEEYLIYQTLVGSWPSGGLPAGSESYIGRIVQYVDKALREAKLHTSWLNPYEEYDGGVANFIRGILADPAAPFVQDLDRFVGTIADAGFTNSLAQLLVKVCAPGVPDFYQGTELWDFNLVDPDNRRPVDFAARRQALAAIKQRLAESRSQLVAELVRQWPDQRIKLFTMWQALQFRKHRASLLEGKYQPLFSDGPRAPHVIAFARVAEPQWAVCVVPRLTMAAWPTRRSELAAPADAADWPLADWWRETLCQLPPDAPRRWRDVFTGRALLAVNPTPDTAALDLGDVFRHFPVALLSGET